MARYEYIDTSPRFVPVDLARQLLPGTFEHVEIEEGCEGGVTRHL